MQQEENCCIFLGEHTQQWHHVWQCVAEFMSVHYGLVSSMRLKSSESILDCALLASTENISPLLQRSIDTLDTQFDHEQETKVIVLPLIDHIPIQRQEFDFDNNDTTIERKSLIECIGAIGIYSHKDNIQSNVINDISIIISEINQLVISQSSLDLSQLGINKKKKPTNQDIVNERYSKHLQHTLANILSLESVKPCISFCLLLECGFFDPVTEWLQQRYSTAHTNSMHVLSLLTNRSDIWQPLLADDVKNNLGLSLTITRTNQLRTLMNVIVRALQFLSVVSPSTLPGNPAIQQTSVSIDNLIRFKALKGLKDMLNLGLIDDNISTPPFFGRHLDHVSPVYTEFRKELSRIQIKFNKLSLSTIEKLNSSCEIEPYDPFDPPNIPGLQMYSILGEHKGRYGANDSIILDNDRDIFASELLCTELIEYNGRKIPNLSKILTVNNVCKLHKLMIFDSPTVEPGQFRLVEVVGSFQFYSTYLVFLPHEEVPQAMMEWEKICSSDSLKALHPVAQAYFVLSSILWFIHPFQDANGRIARLLCNIILKNAGYCMVVTYRDKVLGFEEFVERLLA